MTDINFWPILVASIVAFVVSAFWYSPILFGKEWMKLTDMQEPDESAKKGVWKLYLGQLVVTIVMFAVLGFMITSTGSRTAGDGAFLAFLIWLGFSATTAVGGMFWQKTPLKLVLIMELANLVTWVIGGAIIGAWR
jgi:hypothetical protein